jgi:hypothetical protein
MTLFAKLFFSSLVIGSSAFAATTSSQTSNATRVTDEAPAPTTYSRWTIEGAYQAHSVAGASSPWLGIGGGFRVIDWINLGLRGFVPMSHPVDQSSYALQTFGRFRFVHANDTDFFVEPAFSENFYNFQPNPSYGLSVGVLNRINNGFSVGLIGGLEFAKYVIDSVGLEVRNDYIVYPKVALIADFNF